MPIKTQIINLISSKPKHYSKMIQKIPELNDWVLSNCTIITDNYAEKIYNAINPTIPTTCKRGNKLKFKSITTGYINCGSASKCECTKEKVTQSVTVSKSKQSQNQKQEIIKKAKQTKLERYGDENYNNYEKRTKTCLSKFGVPYYSMTETFKQETNFVIPDSNDIKKIKSKRYGDENYNNREKAKQTKLELYGDENFSNKQKAINTNLERYGVKHFTNTEKAKQTKLKKYSDENYNNSKQTKKTKLERYGDENYTNIKKMHKTKLERYSDKNYNNSKKAVKTCLTKYNRTNAAKSHISNETYEILQSETKFKEFITGKSRAMVTSALNIDFNTVTAHANKYNCHDLFVRVVSQQEEKINQLLITLGINFTRNDRSIISPYELDFYLPEYNIAIEVNGIYYHSEISTGKDKNYHFNKWKQCSEKSIDLYSFTDFEINNKFNIIKSKLTYLTKNHKTIIGARKCIISNISFAEESSLLDEYHIQGKLNNKSGSLGAYYNNELVGVLNWKHHKLHLEITRFVCKTNASYPGLFSKMIKSMINKLRYVGKIISFSDNCYSNGNVYNSSGFTLESHVKPSYYYTKDYVLLENRQRYMKSKIKNKFNIADSDIKNNTEWDLMKQLGYDRYWDCGKKKWILNV